MHGVTVPSRWLLCDAIMPTTIYRMNDTTWISDHIFVGQSVSLQLCGGACGLLVWVRQLCSVIVMNVALGNVGNT